MGELPIISYKNLQESNGLNDKKELKRSPNIYQNQPLYIDPDYLIYFRIQEKVTNRTGK